MASYVENRSDHSKKPCIVSSLFFFLCLPCNFVTSFWRLPKSYLKSWVVTVQTSRYAYVINLWRIAIRRTGRFAMLAYVEVLMIIVKHFIKYILHISHDIWEVCPMTFWKGEKRKGSFKVFVKPFLDPFLMQKFSLSSSEKTPTYLP